MSSTPTAVQFGSPSPKPVAFNTDTSISNLRLDGSQRQDEHPNRPLLPGFPSHGIEAVTITVGNTKQFLIHKNLLCTTSCYFKAALTGHFKESLTNQLKLKDQDPDAFELFYGYLYNSRLSDSHLFKHAISVDIVYLRALKLADGVMAYDFRFAVYERLRQTFNDTFFRIPTKGFIFELYNTDGPLDQLKQYIVAHSTYWISHDNTKEGAWQKWQEALDTNLVFMEEVTSQLLKTLSTDEKHPNRHPILDASLRPASVYPVPSSPSTSTRQANPKTTTTTLTKLSPMVAASFSSPPSDKDPVTERMKIRSKGFESGTVPTKTKVRISSRSGSSVSID